MTIDDLLAGLVLVLVPFSWLSSLVLLRAARRPPRIGALSERAAIALAIAIMVTAGGLITFNRTADHAFFPVDVARIIFSLAIIAVGSVPVAWTILWLTGRLGEGST